MLDDRSYMRSSSFRFERPVTFVLLMANAVIFLLQSLLEFYGIFPVTAYLGLSVAGLAKGYVWQLLTFQFLHGGLWHLLLNSIAIYFFGRAVEEAVGRVAMLKLYFASGAVGGLFQVALALLAPAYFGGSVVGASAGAFGLVAAFATMFPDRLLTLLVFFVIPVSMQARTLLWLSIGLALFGILVPGGNVADAAHLGGILTGVVYVRWVIQGRGWHFKLPSVRPLVRRPRELVKTASTKQAIWQRSNSASVDDLPPEEFISREVDPILDKISAQGIQSLTERERKILEAARAKMSKRSGRC